MLNGEGQIEVGVLLDQSVAPVEAGNLNYDLAQYCGLVSQSVRQLVYQSHQGVLLQIFSGGELQTRGDSIRSGVRYVIQTHSHLRAG